MQTNKSIVIENLSKSFKKQKVLDGLNLIVEQGTILALLGPNGAGKTTTIRILSTLLPADEGEAYINGFSVRTQGDQVRENIGLTGQYAAVDEYLTGTENLVMMARLYHLSKEDSKKRAKELLEEFDLVEAANRAVKTYSGGMRRKLDLAASLVATPPIIFLDEPTTGLDPRSRLAMWQIIEKLKQVGVTILLTTQHMEEADQLADEIVVINDGKKIAQGTSNELKAKVGRERLELVAKNEKSFQQAKQIINGQDLRLDEERKILSIAIDRGVQDVKSILDQMEKGNIEIETLSLHKPTLDDVFLSLTGHKAEKMEEEKV